MESICRGRDVVQLNQSNLVLLQRVPFVHLGWFGGLSFTPRLASTSELTPGSALGGVLSGTKRKAKEELKRAKNLFLLGRRPHLIVSQVDSSSRTKGGVEGFHSVEIAFLLSNTISRMAHTLLAVLASLRLAGLSKGKSAMRSQPSA